MNARYCRRSIPNCKKGDRWDSIAWKHMLQIRDRIEQHILWNLNSGSCSFLWNNLVGTCHLAQFSTNSNRFNNSTVANFQCNGRCNFNQLIQQTPNCQLAGILSIELSTQMHLQDQAIFTRNSDGKFPCSSAWNEIRGKNKKLYSIFFFCVRAFLSKHLSLSGEL